jgi:hypothetical protein
VGGSEQSGECNQATRNRKRERNKGEKKSRETGEVKREKRRKKGKSSIRRKEEAFLG